MSNILNHDGPSRQSCIIDQSLHETSSYGTYTNRGQHASGKGNITNVHHQTNYLCCPSDLLGELDICSSHQDKPSLDKRQALDVLRSNSSLAALVDANERYNPPRCAEATRRGIIRKMEDWVLHDGLPNAPSGIFWLYGGAGVGKSALAQTLAEKFERNDDLAASFFFFRADVNRNDGNRLIPTLAYQLARSFQGLSPWVEENILANPDLFEKNRQTQALKLLIEPSIRLSLAETDGVMSMPALKSQPRLVVIDGLDECIDQDIQCDLLRIIAATLPHLPYPLRFLITSRPESHIAHIFEQDLIDVARYNLSNDADADKDIQNFLKGKFAEIYLTHPLRRYLPSPWPPPGAISSLVDRSSGHFIYAATVMRFIQSPKHQADDRLQVILGLQQPYEKDRPYALLDLLYRTIFRQIEDFHQLEKIHCALGVMHLRSLKCGLFGRSHWSSDSHAIELLLRLKPGDLLLLFDPLLSLVAFDVDNIRIYHKSLFEYLLDSTRSEDLSIDLGWAHESAANHLLQQIKFQYSGIWYSPEFQDFVYHCQFSHLNGTLRNRLISLACDPKITFTDSLSKSLSRDERTQLLQSILYFLQVIGRQDWDSSGHSYSKYVEKETKFLRSGVSWGHQLRSMMTRPILSQVSAGVKRNLGSILRARSSDINLTNDQLSKTNGRTPVPAVNMSVVESIKREHELFSSYIDVQRYPDIVVSFLERSPELVHSCHFTHPSSPGPRVGVEVTKVSFMMLVTYTEDGVRLSCTKSEDFPNSSYTDGMVERHFRNTQKELISKCTTVHSIIFDRVIVCIGSEGSGKTRIIDCLAKTSSRPGFEKFRVTKIKMKGNNVVLIDTPGFGASNTDEVFSHISRWLKKHYENHDLTGIIYLHSISDNHTPRSSLVFLTTLLKPNAGKLMLVTTMWDRTPSEIAESREGMLHSEWRNVLDLGALTDRFDNKEMTAQRILGRMLDD